RTTQLVFITGHLSTTTMSRPEARCHGPTAVSTGQVESRRFSIVTVSRFQRVSAAAGITRTTVEARARAAAMKARMAVLGRFMGWFPFGCGAPLGAVGLVIRRSRYGHCRCACTAGCVVPERLRRLR